jgi:hypothetical protein
MASLVGDPGLTAGAKYVGEQKSGSQSYDVIVDIKHVDLENSYLCGYLQISGLTDVCGSCWLSWSH